MKITIFSLGTLSVLGFALNGNPILDEVKSGNKQLICNNKQVPIEKIVDFDGQTWIFTNGYARNCEVK